MKWFTPLGTHLVEVRLCVARRRRLSAGEEFAAVLEGPDVPTAGHLAPARYPDPGTFAFSSVRRQDLKIYRFLHNLALSALGNRVSVNRMRLCGCLPCAFLAIIEHLSFEHRAK